MKKILICLLLSFLYDDVLCAPQSEVLNSDNSEPDQSKSCRCISIYECEDAKIMDLKIDETGTNCGGYKVCCRTSSSRTQKPYECGKRLFDSIDARSPILEDKTKAKFGEWPWQVLVLNKYKNRRIPWCSGALIDERHILSAAHCFYNIENVDDMMIRLGEWDTDNTNPTNPHEDYDIEQIIIHPQFNIIDNRNDIAILKLDEDVEFKSYINPVCLPRSEDNFIGQNCLMAGWGSETPRGNASVIMKIVDFHVVNRSECQKMFQAVVGRHFKLHRGFLCAHGKEGRDACIGDSGAPLVCSTDTNTYIVAGLSSFGVSCGRPDVAAGFIDVKKYIDWIASETRRSIQDYWNPQ